MAAEARPARARDLPPRYRPRLVRTRRCPSEGRRPRYVDPVIIWVNGAFGSGKTTLVDELHRRRPDALVYDPEQTGFVLRNIVEVPTGDFQDLPLWRSQVAGMAVDLVRAYGRPVLAPMTLVDPGYAEEIFGAVEAAGV